MSIAWRRRLLLVLLLAVGAIVFFTGIGWGLPSRRVDPLLFGNREPWTGQQILALAPARADASLGADVDVNPLLERSRPVVLNETDAQRAEIVRRYRLFSDQPDEMITFSALAQMRPGEGKLDPRLYQYGGLWVYPVGAMLKLASAAGFVPLQSDPAFYLDHPEAFGRFYVVARLYTVIWGLIGVWAVFWLAHRATLSLIAASGAALCYICMPVVVNMSHEAKPHLPGAVLMLCAIIAATQFVETGRSRWWIVAAALCGAAAGMVLSAALVVVIIPVMVMLCEMPWKRRATVMLGGGAVALLVWCITNPYVPINLFANRAVLRSNFANTAAMYQAGRWGEGLINAIALMREGTSLGLLLLGSVAVIALGIRAATRWRAGRGISPVGPLLAAPVVLIVIQFIALAAGKPGEYGRFALLPGIAIGMAAACAVVIFSRRIVERILVIAVIIVITAIPSSFYLLGFIKDSSDRPTRIEDAAWLAILHEAGARTMGLYAEPAPYSLPPVNLLGWRLVLLPRGFDLARDATDVDVIVRPVDVLEPNGASAGDFTRASTVNPFADAWPTRISWAAKPFEVWVRRELLERVQQLGEGESEQ
jgi:hypothetical protein